MGDVKIIQKAVKVFESRLKLSTAPIGVKLLKEGETLPEKVKRPSKMGNQWALCQAFFAARTMGMVVALGREDQSCPVAQSLIGFEKSLPFYSEGNLSQGMFTETLAGGKRSEEVIPHFDYGEYRFILVAPLEKFMTMRPDLVYVYGSPGQVVRLVHGAVYREGGSLTSSFTGRAGCIATIAGTIQSGDCQVVLNGNGERVFGHAQDDEMAFAIPWDRLDEVADGVEATHQGGVRYPYPAFINYTPRFPMKYNELTQMWDDEEEKER